MASKTKTEHYSAELEYQLPVFQTVSVEVPIGTPIEEVCRLLHEAGEDWVDGGTSGYDGSSTTYINALAKGKADNLYGPDAAKCKVLAIPRRERKSHVVFEDILDERLLEPELEDLRNCVIARISNIATDKDVSLAAEHLRLNKLFKKLCGWLE